MRQDSKHNLIHIEFLRILCIWLVMFNHTKTEGFFFFSIAADSPLYWFYMFQSISCKVAVPVFFMISGALLLGKEESLKDLYRKRVLKWAVILVAVSIFYQWYDWYQYGENVSLLEGIREIYSGTSSDALWFLYSYLGILVMLPLLRAMVRSMKANDYLYLAAGQFVFVGLLPILQYLISRGEVVLNEDFDVPLFTVSPVFYFLMGYFFERILEEGQYSLRRFIGMLIGSFVCIVISCMMTQYRMDLTGDLSQYTSQTFYESLIALPSFTLYYGARLLLREIRPGNPVGRVISFAGSTTMGIYLFERILRDKLHFVYDFLKPILHNVLACYVYISVCLLAGICILGILQYGKGLWKRKP